MFVPVSFMGGIAGQYFKQFGITVAAAVFFSLLVARLLTPMLAAYFMRDHGEEHNGDGWLMQRYTRLLRLVGASPLKAVAIGVAILRRVVRQHQLSVLRLHARRGRQPHPDRRRAAAGLAPRRHAEGQRAP